MHFMLKDKLYIHDNIFSHAKSSSWYNTPTYFEWVRKYDEDHLIMTDLSIFNVNNFNNPKKYAWLLESPEITKNSYDFITKNYSLFDKVFTFDKDLLELGKKFILTPVGGCWISEEDREIHKKNKNISMILSSKNNTTGHKFRHKIFEFIKNIDYFGYMNPIEKKIDSLRDYMFSVVVENTKKDYYFTEKLIDCFITGTIPIYWGCPSINNFFDINGMIIFNDVIELEEIIKTIDVNFYENKKEYIIKNYHLAKNYLIAEDNIYKNLKL